MNGAGTFADRVAVVVGGGHGIGAACAATLARAGADLALLDSFEEGPRGSAAIDQTGRRCLALAVDVLDHDALRQSADRVAAELGAVDLLVVATAARSDSPVVSLTDAQLDEALDLGLHGPYHALRVFVPPMAARGFGRVVVVTGDEGRRGVAERSHGAAAAWAAIGLAKSVALETADAGVAVGVVCTTAPPHEAGAALWDRHPAAPSSVTPEVAADAVAYLLAQSGTELSGSVLDVSAGLGALNSG